MTRRYGENQTMVNTPVSIRSENEARMKKVQRICRSISKHVYGGINYIPLYSVYSHDLNVNRSLKQSSFAFRRWFSSRRTDDGHSMSPNIFTMEYTFPRSTEVSNTVANIQMMANSTKSSICIAHSNGLPSLKHWH